MSDLNLLALSNQADIETPENLLRHALPQIIEQLDSVTIAEVYRLGSDGVVLWHGENSSLRNGAYIPLESAMLEQEALDKRTIVRDESVLIVPLIHSDDIFALLKLHFAVLPDLETVQDIGLQLAFSLYTKQVDMLLKQQVEAIRKLNKASSLLEVDGIIGSTMSSAGQYVGMNIFEHDADGKIVGARVIATANRQASYAADIAIEVDTKDLQKLHDALLTDGEVLLSDLATSKRFTTEALAWLQTQNAVSTYLIPLQYDETVHSFINLSDTRHALAPTRTERQFFANIAQQAATIIDRQQLLEGSQKSAIQLQSIAEFGQSIRTSFDASEILNTALEYIPDLMIAEYVGILLYDRHDDALRNSAVYRDKSKSVDLHANVLHEDVNKVAQQAWKNRDLVQIDHINADWSHPLDKELQSIVATPLISGGIVLGILEVGTVNVHHFTEVDTSILKQMSNQLAIALSNADAYAQSQHLARNKSRANDIIANMQQQVEMQDILRVTVKQLGQALGAKRGRIRLGTAPAAQAEDV